MKITNNFSKAIISGCLALGISSASAQETNFSLEQQEAIDFMRNFNQCVTAADSNPDLLAQIEVYNTELQHVNTHNEEVTEEFEAAQDAYIVAWRSFFYDKNRFETYQKLLDEAAKFERDETLWLVHNSKAEAYLDILSEQFEQETGLSFPKREDYNFLTVTIEEPPSAEEYCETQYERPDNLRRNIRRTIKEHGGQAYLDAINVEIVTPE